MESCSYVWSLASWTCGRLQDVTSQVLHVLGIFEKPGSSSDLKDCRKSVRKVEKTMMNENVHLHTPMHLLISAFLPFQTENIVLWFHQDTYSK